MKCVCILLLSIVIAGCNNLSTSKDDYAKINSLADTYYGHKFSCERVYFNDAEAYSFEFKMRYKNVTLNLCRCDSIIEKVSKENIQDTIINSAKMLFKEIVRPGIKYYSIRIYNDYDRHDINRAINLKYDSLKNDFIFYSNEAVPD